jgi:hypothetical protein
VLLEGETLADAETDALGLMLGETDELGLDDADTLTLDDGLTISASVSVRTYGEYVPSPLSCILSLMCPSGDPTLITIYVSAISSS